MSITPHDRRVDRTGWKRLNVVLSVLSLVAFALAPVSVLAAPIGGATPGNSSPARTLTVQPASATDTPTVTFSHTLYLPLVANNAQFVSSTNDGFENENLRLQRQQEYLHEHSDEAGQVRPDLWLAGIQAAKQMKIAAGIPSAPSGAAAPTSGVIGVQWTQIGPAPLRIDQEQIYQGAGPDSGEVVDIAIDPRGASDQVIYLATNDGGIWKSTDGGTSWKPKTDYLPSLSMGAVALDPGNPSIVYAGTGNLFDGAGIFSKGVGLYKSIDGGQTWSQIGRTIFSNFGVNRIVLPAPNVLLVATNFGVYRSIDGGANFGSNPPLFNNGQAVTGNFISDLDLDTSNPSIVYASVRGIGILKSTDSGATFPLNSNLFTASNGGPTTTIQFIAFAQSVTPNSQRMYANVQMPPCSKDSNNNLLPNQTCARLYRSDDGGSTWTFMPDATNRATENNGCQCGYDQTVGVDPQDQNRVYIGYQELYLSTNGGTNFGTPATSRNKIHWDHHALIFSPSTHWGGGGAPTRIWVGTDGGFASSADGGGSWSNLNEGIATNLFFSLDIGRGSAANNAYSYGGTQDTGTIERRPGFSGNDWHLGIDGDGGRIAVDPSNPQRAYGADDGCFIHTTDGGNNWNYCGATGLPSGIGLLKVDPNNGAIVYATVGITLYQSTNTGSSFTAIRAFPNGITALDVPAIDSNVMYVGLANATVQRTSNVLSGTTSTWSSFPIPGALFGQGVSGIAIDPSNTQIAVAVFPGFSGINPPINRTRHVFYTTNGGTSWTDISGTDGGDPTRNLPDLPVFSAVIDPGTSPHTIIVSNDAGVMRTANLGATWEVLGVGLPTVNSRELAIDTSANPPVLRIGTYGRSVFQLTSAANPLIAVNTDLAFGTVPIGTSASRVVQVFNVGSSDLHISSFSRVAGSNAFQIISGPGTPVTVPPGEEIDFTVQYRPTATGDFTATFQFDSDDPFNPAFQIFASGSGVGPHITVSGDLNFGVVARGTTATRSVIVQNTGGAPLVVSSVAFDFGSDPAFSVLGPTTPVTIAAGSSVVFVVQFAPPSNAASGTRTGTLRINSNDPDNPSVTLPATGIVGAPHFTVSSTSLQFGRIAVDDRTDPNTSDQTLRITNQSSCSGCDLNLLSITFSGPAAADYQLAAPPPFPILVGAGNSIDLIVRFNPSAGGARPALMTITTDDPSSPTIQVTLNGEGLLPGILASPSPLIFGPVVFDPICSGLCGATSNASIVNTGQAELILDTLSFSGSPMFSGPAALVPPARVQPFDSSNEAVTFHPSGGPARIVTGLLHIEDTLGPAPTAPPVAADVPLCGESVGRGFRVLVYDTDGSIVPLVTRLSLQSHGFTNPVNIQENDLPLTTIDPPDSCQRIQFHYENQDLQSTDLTGQRGSYYILSITVGNKHATVSFTLGVNEFKTITAVVQ